MPYGASKKEWNHLTLVLGLTADLLPVVSNPNATISPSSKMKGVGKTPSTYNGSKHAIGFSAWTSYVATEADIALWSKQEDYGACLQTRIVRAFDIDVTDPTQAAAIYDCIYANIGVLPKRYRSNSSKFLVIFEYSGDLHKRAFKTEHGIVELLATGQQFIAVGQHTSGVPYEWEGGLPSAIPTVTEAQLEELWSDLVSTFAIEPASLSNAPVKQEVLNNAISNDPIAVHLGLQGLVKSTERDGRLHIECPFAASHTGPSADSATTYFPANTGGFVLGHFDCKHAHCSHRTDEDFKLAIGYNDLEFDDLTAEAADDRTHTSSANTERYKLVPAHEFAEGVAPSWLVKGLIPKAELVVMFGASGSGKSFMALDIAASIATGTPWRSLRVKKGRVVYIAAEGAGGFRNRLKAYEMSKGVPLTELDLLVIAAAPNFLEKQDSLDLVACMLPFEPTLVIVDTWAQTTPGGNENSGEDMGKALKNCRGIHRATGATVLLIHHSGKNASAGARGWSGLRAAADAELEVLRNGDDRVLSSTKQKDGEDGAEYGFKLDVIPLGLDMDGDVVSSCVVSEADVVNVKAKNALGKVEQALLEAAGSLVGLDGSLPDENSVRDSAVELLPLEDEKRDRRKYLTGRALAKLVEKGLLIRNEGRIQLA